MGKLYESITPPVRKWIERQKMFFVATAPRADSGRINLSPKGHNSLRILDEHTLAYLDFGGSGIETIAHIRENGRIVIMMCAFEGPAKIFRFYGTGRVVTPQDPTFDSLAQHFDRSELGIRAIICIDVDRIADSCGFGVPLYDYREDRTIAPEYMKTRGADYIRDYQLQKNLESIDGLPGMEPDEANAWSGPVNAPNTDD